MYAAPGLSPNWKPSGASVAALYCNASSPYWSLPGVDVFDLARDARSFPGGMPVVAHPPCRAWGRLRHFAKPRADERDLAFHARDCVRRFGGVLEHPQASRFIVEHCPRPGERDQFGGFVVHVLQSWFGHRAPKATALYICGIEPGQLPLFPFALGIPSGRVELMGRAERERTPIELATWLVSVSRLCGVAHA